MNILDTPMTTEQALAVFPDKTVDVVIELELDDFIGVTLDSLLDVMESKVVTGSILGNISYSVVGFRDLNVLQLQIVGEIMSY